jgi:hypothetical protein
MSWITSYTLFNHERNGVLVAAYSDGCIDPAIVHSIELELMAAALMFSLLSVTGLKFTQLERRPRLENKQAPKYWFGMFLSKPRKEKSWIYLSMCVFVHCGDVR